METDRLKYFCTICELGSLSKAAEILNVSHSGLSKAMTLLQDELDMTLFRPQGRGIEPTPAAKEVYDRSKRILEMIEDFKAPNPTTKKHLRVGLVEIFSLALSPEIGRLFPHEDFEIHDADAGEIESKILADQIDFGISFVPYPHPDLEYLKLAKAPFAAFKKEKSLKGVAIAEIPFVTPMAHLPNNPLSLKIRDGWPAQLPRKTPFHSSSLKTALGIVESGNTAIFIPRFLAKKINETRVSSHHLEEIEFPMNAFKNSVREVFLVKRKSAEETAEMKILAKAIRQICREE